MTDLTPENTRPDEHLPDDETDVPFVDPSPPELPPDVWRRSLAIALDPTAEPHEELVPGADTDDNDDDLALAGADDVQDVSTDEDLRDDDHLGIPDPTSSEALPYPDASPGAEDNASDPF